MEPRNCQPKLPPWRALSSLYASATAAKFILSSRNFAIASSALAAQQTVSERVHASHNYFLLTLFGAQNVAHLTTFVNWKRGHTKGRYVLTLTAFAGLSFEGAAFSATFFPLVMAMEALRGVCDDRRRRRRFYWKHVCALLGEHLHKIKKRLKISQFSAKRLLVSL